jgi:hypothetical protein
MVRSIALAAILAALSVTAVAQDQPAGRYALQSSVDGFVRLDTRTGAVSHCGRRDGLWFCEPFAEEGAALTTRVEALEAEVKTLREQLARLTARPPAATGTLDTPSDEELEKALGFSETVMKRFFGMVREMKESSRQ